MATEKTRLQSTLRWQAEQMLKTGKSATTNIASVDEAKLLLHELQVHQIELELQNEELRRVQAELEASKVRYFDLYDLAPVGYCTLSEPGLIQEANLTTATLLGMDRGELIKQPISRFIFSADQDIFYLHRKKLMASGLTQSFELRLVGPDRQTFWALLHCSLAPHREYRLTFSDISERKRLEAQLRQSQKMEVVGTLAGGIAHDFNNILTGILGFAEIVMEALPPDSPHRKHQAYVIQGGERARDLVKQILTFSRKTEHQAAPTLLQPIIKEALKLLRASLPATIEIKEEIDLNFGPVMADPIQIHQLLMNLCTNAKQAMHDTGGVMSVSLKPVKFAKAEVVGSDSLPAGRYALLEITDTGCGLSPGLQERIFDPYFTTKERGKGTGLGLAVVQGIATAMGGAVSVTSAPGRGATFRVYLPLNDKERCAEKPPVENVPGGKNESVLLVDDEEAIANLESVILTNLGYRVTKFSDSAKTLQAFQAAPKSFDLLITDMTMPKLTGTELASEVMRLRPEMPIILCTGFSELVDAKKAKDLGIREYLTKPLSRGDLARAARRALAVRE